MVDENRSDPTEEGNRRKASVAELQNKLQSSELFQDVFAGVLFIPGAALSVAPPCLLRTIHFPVDLQRGRSHWKELYLRKNNAGAYLIFPCCKKWRSEREEKASWSGPM